MKKRILILMLIPALWLAGCEKNSHGEDEKPEVGNTFYLIGFNFYDNDLSITEENESIVTTQYFDSPGKYKYNFYEHSIFESSLTYICEEGDPDWMPEPEDGKYIDIPRNKIPLQVDMETRWPFAKGTHIKNTLHLKEKEVLNFRPRPNLR